MCLIMKYTVLACFAFTTIISQQVSMNPECKQLLIKLINQENHTHFKNLLIYQHITYLDEDIYEAAEQLFNMKKTNESRRVSLLSPAGQILVMVCQRCPTQKNSAKMTYPFRVIDITAKHN